jgi:ribosomal-protein-alanine N-acetyltransferase
MDPSLFFDLPPLTTARLTLRKMSLRDLQDVFAYGRDPEVSKYTLWDAHRTVDEARLYLNDVVSAQQQGLPHPWGIVEQATKKVIGTIGYGDVKAEHGRCEVGYVLARPSWGKGYATEALREVLLFGFDEMQMNRIEARCFEANTASARVLEKAGMSFEGLLRQHIFAKGGFQTLRQYAVLAEDGTSR